MTIGANNRRFSYQPSVYEPKQRKNAEIKSESVFLIDEDGGIIGKTPTSKAIELAQEKDLDLIEISPNADPPVAKILSWSKFKYAQEKKRKDSKSKSIEMKEMWFKPFIGDKDLEHKLKKVEEFIKKKHSVKLTIRAKGRIQKEHLTNVLNKILSVIEEYAEFQGQPKFQGRNLGIIVIPRKTKLIKVEKANEEQNQNTQSEPKEV